MTENEARTITDSGVLAALAHPLRRRLMDVLRVYGPATASMLAERTEQAVANVSHHLRVLGASQLIEEAPELARDKRERWWRRASAGLRWNTSDFRNDPAAEAAADTIQSMALDQHVTTARTWFGADRAEQERWGNGPFTIDRWMQLTPEEIQQLSRDLDEVFRRWGNRETPDDGKSREPVLVFAYGVPGQP